MTNAVENSLPEWDLNDLYKGIDDVEIERDLKFVAK